MKSCKNGKPFICFVVTWHKEDTGIVILCSELKVNIRLWIKPQCSLSKYQVSTLTQQPSPQEAWVPLHCTFLLISRFSFFPTDLIQQLATYSFHFSQICWIFYSADNTQALNIIFFSSLLLIYSFFGLTQLYFSRVKDKNEGSYM